MNASVVVASIRIGVVNGVLAGVGSEPSVVKKIVADGDDGSNPYGGGKPKNPAQIISIKKK